MIGIGTLINSVSIVAGGLVGHFAGKLFRAEQQDALTKACGISTMFIAIAGAMPTEETSSAENPCWWCCAWLSAPWSANCSASKKALSASGNG